MEINAEALGNIVKEHGNVESVDTSGIRTVPLDPACTTYELSGHWIKVMKSEPKNPKWTLLHREFFGLDSIARNNRQTVDYKLHVPIPEPRHVGSDNEQLGKTYLLTEKIGGEPMMNIMYGGKELDEEEKKIFGEQIGRFLARTHAVALKGVGLINPDREGVHPGPWLKYFLLVAEAQWRHIEPSDMIDSGMVKELAALTNEEKGMLIGETVTLNHNSFQPTNIWLDRAEKKITGFVNLSQVAAGSPMVDICSFYIHCHDNKLWEEFRDGYGALRSFPPKMEEKLAYYGFVFALHNAWVFHRRKDEANKGYYLRRAFESASDLRESFQSEASKYSSYTRPQFGKKG